MTEIRDLDPKFKEGFKFNYTKVKNAVMACELENKEKQISQKCRQMFKELNIDILE